MPQHGNVPMVVPRIAVGEHGWRVTFAGMGINLALGILYTWSIIAGGIENGSAGEPERDHDQQPPDNERAQHVDDITAMLDEVPHRGESGEHEHDD